MDGIAVETLHLSPDESVQFRQRWLGDADRAVYLMRPDQHVAARWRDFDRQAVLAALARATGRDAPAA